MPQIIPRAPDAQQIARANDGIARRTTMTANTNSHGLTGSFSESEQVKRAAAKAEAAPTEGQVEQTEQTESGQATVLEGQESQVAETPKEVKLSPQVTALARREQQFRQKEQAFKAKEQEIAAKEAKLIELEALSKSLSSKDFAALEKHIPYEEYTQYLLNKGEAPENDPVKMLEAKLSKLEAAQEENNTKQFESIKNQYRTSIKDLISKDPYFEAIKENQAEEHVLQHILDTFEQDDVTLTVEEAAKEVEDALFEDAMKMANLKKVQAHFAPKKQLAPPTQAQPKAALKTITQQIAPSTKTYAQSQHLSPRERLAAALSKAQQRSK